MSQRTRRGPIGPGVQLAPFFLVNSNRTTLVRRVFLSNCVPKRDICLESHLRTNLSNTFSSGQLCRWRIAGPRIAVSAAVDRLVELGLEVA